MALPKELENALLELEVAASEFDAIDEELEQLTKKIAFFSSSPSVPAGSSQSAIQECAQQITAHEKAINHPLSHFNKAVSRKKTQRSLNMGTATPATLESIDELVRTHLYETGYASVGEAMQENAPHHALGHDAFLKHYGYESYINSTLHYITSGEAGLLEDNETEPAIKKGGAARAQALRAIEAAEAFLYDAYNSKTSRSPNDPRRIHTERQSRQTLHKFRHWEGLSEAFIYTDEEQAWQNMRRLEYEFLKSLRHGIGAALAFLQSHITPNEISGLSLGPEQVTEFMGKLVVADPANADTYVHGFVLQLRTELLNRVRREPSEYKATPRTDLKLLVDISAQAQQKYLLPLQTTNWTGEDELPVEIETDASVDFHPIFVCPVTKDQATDLVLLPCGHLLSRAAADEILAKSHANEKCPYCPKLFNARRLERALLPQSIHEELGVKVLDP